MWFTKRCGFSGAAVGARCKSALWNVQRAEMSDVLALRLSWESDRAVGESRYHHLLPCIHSSGFVARSHHHHMRSIFTRFGCVTGVRRLVIVEAGSKRVEGIISLSDVFKFLLGL